MTLSGRSIERELAMVKLRGTGEHRVEALRLAEAVRARVIDGHHRKPSCSRSPGNSAKINQFIDLMRPLGLVEVSRTGVAAIGRRGARGCEPMLARDWYLQSTAADRSGFRRLPRSTTAMTTADLRARAALTMLGVRVAGGSPISVAATACWPARPRDGRRGRRD